MKEKILKILLEHNISPNKEALDFIISQKDPISYVNEILKNDNLPIFLSVQELKNIVKIEKPKELKKIEKKVMQKKYPEIIKREEKPFLEQVKKEDYEINILKDITGESTSEGKIEDFSKYFNDRYNVLKKIIKIENAMIRNESISYVKKHGEENVKIIGIVTNKRKTQKGNLMIELEDENDNIRCLISSDNPLYNEDILVDEVIGVFGKKLLFPGQRSQDFLSLKKIIRPEGKKYRKINKAEVSGLAVFISDIHIGSSTFLYEPWERFLKWLNEKNEISKKLKYLIVSGDNVDGIGIYPNQEEELKIFDIYAQYEALAKEFEKIPDDIKIVILPGNHDAVRPAEPQPALQEQIQELFNSNIMFVGNPCYFSINGVEILAYHGRSMDDYITQIRRLNYSNPIESMIEMLKRRHLATVYGARTPISPEHKDYLVIDRIPDIFVTGHVHSAGIERFRDILLINSSTWQSQTTYQKMLNFSPIPAKVPIVDLESLKFRVIDFMTETPKYQKYH